MGGSECIGGSRSTETQLQVGTGQFTYLWKRKMDELDGKPQIWWGNKLMVVTFPQAIFKHFLGGRVEFTSFTNSMNKGIV